MTSGWLAISTQVSILPIGSTHRATGTVDKLNVFRQQLVEAEFKNGVGMTTAHFHNPQRAFGGVRDVKHVRADAQLTASPVPASDIHQQNALFFLAIQQRTDIRLNVKHVL